MFEEKAFPALASLNSFKFLTLSYSGPGYSNFSSVGSVNLSDMVQQVIPGVQYARFSTYLLGEPGDTILVILTFLDVILIVLVSIKL